MIASRMALGSKMGMSHKGNRDLFETLGYPNEVTSKDLTNQWKRQAIARAAIERPIKRTWQGDVFLTEPGQEEKTELEQAWKSLDERIQLKSKLSRVDRLSRLGEYAILLLGFDDIEKRADWKRPVQGEDRSLLYARPVGRQHADIHQFQENTSDPRFGLPKIYEIELSSMSENSSTNSSNLPLKVHQSRIIHVAFELLEDEIRGEPLMNSYFNRLKDLEKLVGGSAEMFWRGARPGYFGTNKEDYGISEPAEKRLREQLDEYEHNLRRFIVAEGLDINNLAQQISDPKGHVQVQLQMLSAVTNIPLRILVGSERGEMASSQDQSEFNSFIDTRRTEEVEPTIVRPLANRLIKYGALPAPLDSEVGYSVSWPDLFRLGQKERAEVGSELAGALNKYAQQPLAEQFVPLEPFLRYFLKLDEDTVSQILQFQESEMNGMLEEQAVLEDLEEFEES